MKRFIWIGSLIIVAAGIAFGIGHQPTPASAGGWPCFLCHGGFESLGTDLAPQLAGSKLTDEQILAQVREPRGVMPAFGKEEFPDQVLKDGFINAFVRGKPSGQPTATLSARDSAMALATIAAVAATRSVEYSRQAGSSAIQISFPTTQTPTPAISPTPIARPARRDTSLSPAAIAAIGGLLAVMVAAVWFGLRR